jgi:hypothetical protein
VSGKVVSLHGETLTPASEPVASVIEMVEELLEMAKSGELRGINAAMLCRDDQAQIMRAGLQGVTLLGAVVRLQNWMCREMDEMGL